MKVRVPLRDLAAAADWSARRLEMKPLQPVMAGLLLEARGETLTVSGVSQSGSTRTALAADVLEEGRVCLSGRLFAQVLATYRGEMVELTVDDQAIARCEASEFRFSVLPDHDYPQVANLPQLSGTVAGDLLAETVQQVGVATDSSAVLEPWRGGIRLSGGPDSLKIWATDRYRVACRSIPWVPACADDAEAFIPAGALMEAAGAMAGADVQLALRGQTAGISGSGSYLTVTCIDPGNMPDALRIYPKDNALVSVAEVPIKPLVDAVKRACLVEGDRKAKVLLGTRDDDTLSVRAAGSDTGAVSMDSVPGRLISGIPMQVAFQPSLLLPAIQAISSDVVRIAYTAPNRPALITPLDDSDLRFLVMSVRLT